MLSAMSLNSAAVNFLTCAVVLACCISFFPSNANAQGSLGQDAVYPASGTCCQGSPSFIDASMFAASGLDFCAVLYSILHNTTYPSTGAVIDARALPFTTTSMTCASGTTPWNNGITYVNAPSTILLPLGIIGIQSTWVLPSNTHLIGGGDGIPVASVSTPGTTLQVASGSSLTSMIQFGTASPCTGVSVERLTLDGQAQAVDGIINQYCHGSIYQTSSYEGSSYVDHVSLYQILGTGLYVSGAANDSGPYSNITFDTGTYSGLSSTVCAQIKNVMSGSVIGRTHGIHGLYCKSETNDAQAAVLLDSSNNSVEDTTVVGFYDGVRVGWNGVAQSNVMLNIVGNTSNTCYPNCLSPVATVRISNNYTVTDLSIMGVSNSGLAHTYSIYDDVTATYLPEASVAVYALGESNSNGYSRFTTSPNAATWASGNSAPASGSCTTAAGGSLFSNSGGSGYALYVCPAGGGSGVNWKGIM